MLTNLQPVDRGAYVCRGENGEGNAVTSVSNVHVMGKGRGTGTSVNPLKSFLLDDKDPATLHSR